MWKDNNDRIEELYIDIMNVKEFPAICPICKKKDAHIYMNIYNDKTRKGGFWVWCSKCYTFSHGLIYVPEYWENCSLVKKEKLCAIPEYLNEIKGEIDAHVNEIINKRIRKGL